MKFKNNAKLAVIGCGAVTQNFYIPAIKSLGIKPLFFVDKNIKSAQACAKKFKGAIGVASIDEILNDFSEAIITLPNTLHHPFAMKLISHNKNLLIEKPISVSSVESKEIHEIAKKNGVSVICGNMRRQLRSAQFVKNIINNNILGDVTSFKCREGGIFNWPIQSESFWYKEFSGGGVLLDTGSHTLEQIIYHLGVPNELIYYDNQIDNVESDCIIKFHYNNFKGSLQLSRTIGLDCRFFIEFENGKIIFDLIGNKIDMYCSEQLKEKANYSNFKQNNQSYDDLISKQIDQWYKLISNEDATNVVTTKEAHEVMKIIDFCYNNRNEIRL